jgi:hypothetical protein
MLSQLELISIFFSLLLRPHAHILHLHNAYIFSDVFTLCLRFISKSVHIYLGTNALSRSVPHITL